MLLLQVLLIVTIFGGAHFDCGCNKANRNEPKSHFTENDETQKVCQQKARTNNIYRDYYPEEEIPKVMSLIPGGTYLVGAHKDEPHFESDAETPERSVKIQDFYMDKYEVSNKRFQEFVLAMNHTTEAELFGDSFLFKSLLSEQMQKDYEDFRVVNALWWYKVRGVSWKQPNGPGSSLEGLMDHPVVHVSWNDAVAYCKWRGKRLPTEVEWEVACRGGKKRKLFPWGNKLMPMNKHWLNIWQGDFPDQNTKDDGYETTCPVSEFRQNTYDLYNIVGNVWEWTQDLWNAGDKSAQPNRVKKGGSYLCQESYCYRYRCAARSQNTEDSSSGNLGFRCAKDL